MLPLNTWTYEQMLWQAALSKDIVTPFGGKIYLRITQVQALRMFLPEQD